MNLGGLFSLSNIPSLTSVFLYCFHPDLCNVKTETGVIFYFDNFETEYYLKSSDDRSQIQLNTSFIGN